VSTTITEVGTFKDFEVIWIDRFTRQPKDMDNVTFEMYHYEASSAGEITSTIQEPYMVTEGLNDTLNIMSVCPASGYFVDSYITLQLNLICDNLDALGCPPNNFTVCGTTEKVSIVNGNKVYALSACELATIINLDASGFTAVVEEGFIVIKSDLTGSDCYIEVGTGTLNGVIGLTAGDTAYGNDTMLEFDITAQPAIRISTGRYIYPNVGLSQPPFTVGERYYAMFRGTEPVTLVEEFYQEDFNLVCSICNNGNNLTYSFIK